jgi:shikimate dehydrogenase
MEISGKTKVFGVIGDPVAHSLSPSIHNAAFQRLKLNCVFLAFRVKPTELENALRGMRGLEIVGLNVTMPHKHSVLAWLDEVDATAKFLGSVNTICNRDGRLIGYSTDGVGALKALQENRVALEGKKVLLLGGGGAAKAIAYAFAPEVDEVVMLNRTLEKVKPFAETVSQKLGEKVICGVLSAASVKKHIADADIVVNATSVGMFPNVAETLVPPKLLQRGLTVIDIVYHPIETQLAKDAKAAGARVVSGLEMLIYQGAASFEIWMGHRAPVEVMRKAVLDSLSASAGDET